MKRFQWKWIFTGSKTCCTIWRPFWIQNGRQNKKNPPIWTKFGFQVDYDVANWYPSFGSHIISYLVVFAPILIMSPKRSFRRHIVFALFLINSPNEVWRLIFFAPFLIIIKSPNEVWRLIVFAPFLLIIIMNICQNLWPHLYRKLPKGFPQDMAYILNRVGRIFWQKKSRANGRHF